MEANESQYVHVNGLRMHLRVRGPADAPALLLLHGIMGNAWEWDTAIDHLDHRFRVYAVDQRGHGRSEWTGPYTAKRMGRDAAALAEALSLGAVTLVGHSMGGLAAVFAAAQHPEKFSNLVIIDVGPHVLSSEAGPGISETLQNFAEASYAAPSEAVKQWLDGDPLARPELMRHYVENGLVQGQDRRWRWRYDALGLREFLSHGVDSAAVEGALASLQPPTLVLRGEHSRVLTRLEAEEMAKRIPCGSWREVRGAGHDMGVQQPEAVARHVLSFVGGERPRPAPALVASAHLL